MYQVVIAKCGKQRIHHWAHQNTEMCDTGGRQKPNGTEHGRKARIVNYLNNRIKIGQELQKQFPQDRTGDADANYEGFLEKNNYRNNRY